MNVVGSTPELRWCVPAGTFHKCTLQDTSAGLNSVEIPHLFPSSVNIYAGTIFSLHIGAA